MVHENIVELRVRRVYDPAEASDGYRVLVDRLWPRGLTKEKADLDLWAKDVAPSTELRKRWHHSDAPNWDTLAAEYASELDQNPALGDLANTLVAQAGTHPVVTLLYGAHDAEHNHVRILLPLLESAMAAAHQQPDS